jgi:hypothetical protein
VFKKRLTSRRPVGTPDGSLNLAQLPQDQKKIGEFENSLGNWERSI